MARPKRYGFLRFMLDVVLTIITGGIWLLWMAFSYIRRRTA